MPFYSDDIIEEVRSRSPIVDVIGSYVHLTKKGGNYFGLCPFHNEKTSSFSVSPAKQMYHCFGCGKGGNVISFIMEYENYSFPEAMELLANRAGITLPKREFTKEQKQEQDLRSMLLAAHKDAALFYVHVLNTDAGKQGRAYFERRRLSPETIRAFGLGYSTAHPDALYRYLRSKGYDDKLLSQSGLVTINERGAHDKFWNRVMFPIMDTNNRVIAFGGRVMGDGEPKYLNSPETRIFDKSRNLYGLNAARRTKEKFFLVCEGYMDVISMHQAGFTNAVASLGTAFTSQHGMIMKRYTEEVVLCYDSDGAGRKAALRAIPILREAGLKIRVLDMSPYKDPDEFIKELGAEEFRKRIDQAANAFLFEVAVLREQYQFDDPDDKARFFNETAKMLANFADEIERNAYIEAVSNRYGMDYKILKNKVNLIGNQVGLTKKSEDEWKPKSTVKKREKNAGLREAEKLILTALSENPALYPGLKRELKPSDFGDELMRSIAEALYRQLDQGKDALNPGAIINAYIDSDRASEAAAVFSSTFAENLDDSGKAQALREAVIRVRENALDRQIAETQDPKLLMDLLKEKRQLRNIAL